MVRTSGDLSGDKGGRGRGERGGRKNMHCTIEAYAVVYIIKRDIRLKTAAHLLKVMLATVQETINMQQRR